MIDKLRAAKHQILFIELCGLLHDIGKLSKAFLEYRQKWHERPNGYNEDPHDHDYLNHERFKDIIPPAFYAEIKEIGRNHFCEPDFSIKKAVHSHVSPKTGDLINLMLKAADGVDSAIDRNNPLWSAEQKGTIFKSNVFGCETGRIVTFEGQEDERKELYKFLNGCLDMYLKDFQANMRADIFKEIKKVFDQGLADTTRPANDTTLWDHSYAVASILKVLAVHNLLNDDSDKKIYEFKKVKFNVFGIGWDGMRFISYGQKIGDIVGREKIIDDVKKELKILIEHETPIGNEIYADNDGIYFIVPVGFDGCELEAIRDEIKDRIYKIAAEESNGELFPYLVDIPDTNTLTSLVRAITKMKGKIAYPYDNSEEGYKYFKDKMRYKDGKTICPICRLRPVEKEDEKKKICSLCKKRRSKDKDWKETLFIDEIVDKNKRAALIVARFGLEEWLNGNMVRSLFVTEAEGIEKEIKSLPITKQFEEEEKKIKEFLDKAKCGEVNYSRIKDDIDSFKNKDSERAKHTAFLYDQRVKRGSLYRDTEETNRQWEYMLKEAQKEHPDIGRDDLLYNLLNAKTPTPSSIFDVWNTTLGFITDMSEYTIKSFFPEQIRLGLDVTSENETNLPEWSGTKEAEIVSSRKKIELLYEDDGKVEVVGEKYSDNAKEIWDGRAIKLTVNATTILLTVTYCHRGTSFLPYRTISTTPNLFMAIVPAHMAVEISALIYQKYIEQFGKAMGRLPFSIGNIFFDRKIPMFVVLDAGKRMIANFDVLAKKEGKKEFSVTSKEEKTADDIAFNLKCKIEGFNRTLRWKLPHKLGNCENDNHHPYFTVKEDATKDYSSRKNYFKTVAGDVIHFTEVEPNDVLKLYPNYYDFEFLDSNARRHDIGVNNKGRRKSNVANFKSKPFLLDELGQKIMCLWDVYLKGNGLQGITDTKLRNLQSLWLTKYQEWIEPDRRHKDNWKTLVNCTIEKEFPQIDSDQHSLLMETIDNGMFFDTLELYLGILKERIDEK